MKLLVQFSITLIVLSIIYQPHISGQDLSLPENYPNYKISANNSPDPGYLFITSRPMTEKFPAYMMIMDNYGTPVYYRYMPEKAGSMQVQRNGLLSFKKQSGSVMKFFIMDSSYVVIDSIGMDDYILDDHDFMVLENGHFLLFGLDLRTVDMTSYGGEVDASLEGCVIRELDENKNTVFEWNSWDHYSITDTYKDLTKSSVVLVHPNSLDIDEDGNILLIARAMDEVTKINRVTGDIIWRLGGKNNQFTFSDSSHMFSMPHDFRSLGDGHYTLFDNGNGRDPSYSRAVEYELDTTNMTAEMVWEFDADKEVYGRSGGSTRRLPSGNTILGYGGKVSRPATTEVHPDGSKAFQLDFIDDLNSGRAVKFPWQTNLFELNKYKITFGEWDGYTTSHYLLTVKNNSDHEISITGYSTRTDAFGIDATFPVNIAAGGEEQLKITYYPININTGYVRDVITLNSDIDSDTLIQRIAQQITLSGTKIDLEGPTADISLASAQDVPTDTVLYIILSEPVRLTDDRELTWVNVDSLITFRKDNADGENVTFDAIIHSDKDFITINPEENLDSAQTYYIAVSGDYEDYTGNQGTPASASFTTVDDEATQIDIYPSYDGMVKISSNPAEGSFILEFPDDKIRTIRVFDLSGRRIFEKDNIHVPSYHLNLGILPDALYIIHVREVRTGRSIGFKLMKN